MLLRVCVVLLLIHVAEGLMCYECANSSDENGKNDCQKWARTQHYYRWRYEQKGIMGKYMKNCTGFGDLPEWEIYCMITAVELGDTYPLHDACRLRDSHLVKRLLSEGVSANHCNFDFVQPLHEACFSGSAECTQILIDAGAQVNGRNIDGATPLCDACSSGSEECVRILLENGAFVNPALLLSSPLHEAVLRDQSRCTEMLVAAGANLNHTDCHFGTPLHAAVYKGSINCVRVLLQAGCNVDSVKILNTPLHVAARQQDLAIVSLLLEFGANPHKKNNFDQRPRTLVPSATSTTWKLLHFWERYPRDLKSLCRQVIRRQVGVTRLKHMDKLPLPTPLLNYVSHVDTRLSCSVTM